MRADAAPFAGDPAPSPDDPLWSGPPLRHRADLSALGHPVVVRSNAQGIVDLARTAFGRFAPPDPGRPGLALDVVAGAIAAIGAAREPIHREREGTFLASDGDGGLVVVDLAAGRGTGFVGDRARPAAVRAVVLEASAYRFVTWHGLCALHAAAVVVGGRALVLRGAGGAGKSTLAYAAARAGHELLAEEVTWWDARAASLRGTPWWLRLEPEAEALFPEVGAAPVTARAQGAPKRVVDAAAFGLATVERATAGPLVFLDAPARRPAASSWRALGLAEARKRFAAEAIPGEHAQPPERLAAAVDALLAQGAFALEAGAPEGAVGALESIAGAAERAG